MKELHIPYGIERDTSNIIEPEDAVRGRACNCLCPGCGAPLQSRHPQSDDKRIHFAHDSKHADAKPLEECPLSPFVALGMMLRHITAVLLGRTISLTGHGKSINFQCCSSPSRFVSIADTREGVITDSVAAPTLGGVTYDLVLTIDGKPYFVEIVYPGKPTKDLPAGINLEGVGGILTISGPEFMEMMAKEEGEHRNLRYSDAVVYFLLKYSRKFWSYHSNENGIEIKARESHICKPSHSTKQYRQSNASGFHNKNTNSFTPKYTTYSTYPPQQDNREQLQRPKSTQELADEYLKGSKGDSGYRRTDNRNRDNENVVNQYHGSRTRHEENVFQRDDMHQNSLDELNPQSESTYECVFCTIKFVVSNQQIPSCPKCKSHLGSRRL